MRNSPAAESGFTLLEMIVVLVILGLVLGILLGRGPTRSVTVDLTAASRTLTDELRHARGEAITTDRAVRITADQARAALAAASRRNQVAPIALALHSPASDPHRDGTLRFDADGSSGGGRIDLAEGPARISIVVDWLTGRISQGPIRRDDGS